jgi:hypothetical protein
MGFVGLFLFYSWSFVLLSMPIITFLLPVLNIDELELKHVNELNLHKLQKKSIHVLPIIQWALQPV